MGSLNVGSLGEYIREQRRSAQYSLRQLADAAGVSNPYLSQIERGLRKPSAEILQQIAKALRISAESLYVQAGILDERDRDAVEVHSAILTDPTITERQKQVLLQIYESFRKENASADAEDGAEQAGRGSVPPPVREAISGPAPGAGAVRKKTAARKRAGPGGQGAAPVKRVATETARKVAEKVAGRAARSPGAAGKSEAGGGDAAAAAAE